MAKPLSNIEVVTLAVYLLGGDADYIDTEDIAVKANELSPSRFTWKKYPEQINIEKVRTSLSDAKKIKNGSYLLGLHTKGWLLSVKGLEFCKILSQDLQNTNLSELTQKKQLSLWQRREKIRMLSTTAFEKMSTNNEDTVSLREAETFFRLDEYVTGESRMKKINRIVTAFSDDPDLGLIVNKIAKKVSEKNDTKNRT